jgi:hypothetical protein
MNQESQETVSTKVTTDFMDAKKSFDEISAGRFCVMAMGSLSPDEFEEFISIYNTIIERRNLQNEPISY